MTFKGFVVGFLELPAKVLGIITGLFLGSNEYNKDGSVNEKRSFPGLLGFVIAVAAGILSGVRAIGRGITGLIDNHQRAIATAFWMSLLAAGAAALTLALWPAALAAVANFTIAGFSIASVFGASAAVQIGAAAGISVLLASTVTYTIASIVNFVNFLKNCCSPKAPAANQADFVAAETIVFEGSAKPLGGLGKSAQADELSSVNQAAPVHVSLLQPRQQASKELAAAPVEQGIANASI